jgi:hypothetical protein
MHRRFWTTGEIARLKILYPNTPMNELMALLNRPAAAITAKARDLGVKRSSAFFESEHSGRVKSGNKRGLSTRFKSLSSEMQS